MNHRKSPPRAGGGRVLRMFSLAAACLLPIASGFGQEITPPPSPIATPTAPAPASVVTAPEAVPLLAPDVQVVRFSAPIGTKIEILGPNPEPIAAGTDPTGASLTVGLRVGVAYRLKLSDLPNVAAGSELYPVVELVGHLHRPPGIDPFKYPIRIMFEEDDFSDASARTRLVTKVIYLEAPDQAIPISLPKDQIPSVTLSPVEDPIKVAPALGRMMAIVRIGGRAPTEDELSGAPEWPLGSTPCPFATAENGRCQVACAPVRATTAPGRPLMPRDEFLCDGGDHGQPAGFSADGSLAGIEPKDAVFRFRAETRNKVLPTNTVCIYAPRFAAVRSSLGPNQEETIEYLRQGVTTARGVTAVEKQFARKMSLTQAAELSRLRTRASGLKGQVSTLDHVELRVLQGYDVETNISGNVKIQGPVSLKGRQQGAVIRDKIKLQGLKTAESAVVTGLVEGLGEKVMAWKPQELNAVEVPPNKPGLAVVKQVNAFEAEPGDVVTYTIRYRNIGNVPITSVSVVDSLLPRLEYVENSAMGPKGTVFTAGGNVAGSTELRWDLSGAIAPGADGYVEFKARVR